eukprot:7529549-Karenia_brevis.AAC.1
MDNASHKAQKKHQHLQMHRRRILTHEEGPSSVSSRYGAGSNPSSGSVGDPTRRVRGKTPAADVAFKPQQSATPLEEDDNVQVSVQMQGDSKMRKLQFKLNRHTPLQNLFDHYTADADP